MKDIPKLKEVVLAALKRKGILNKDKFMISVIIPCHNEQDFIKNCLSSLEKQTIEFDAFEVIVVDNASTDCTQQRIAEYRLSSKLQITLIDESRQGVSNARNAGASISRGEILVFLDADNLSHPNLLANIKKQVQKSGYKAGMIKTMPSCRSVFGFGLFAFLDIVKKKGPRPFGKNFCLREIFFAIGGYNDAIALGENVEFLLRIKKWLKRQNRKLAYVPIPVYCSMRRFCQEGYTKVLWQWLKGYIGHYSPEYKVIR